MTPIRVEVKIRAEVDRTLEQISGPFVTTCAAGRKTFEPGERKTTYRKVRSERPRNTKPHTAAIRPHRVNGVIGCFDARDLPGPPDTFDIVRDLKRQRNTNRTGHRARRALSQFPTVDRHGPNGRPPLRPLSRVGQQPPEHLGFGIDGAMDTEPSHAVTLTPSLRLVTARGLNR